jgi:Ca-activated chloride channel family protein
MRRTGLIYGVAASTLIGAFLLKPEDKPEPPPPPPKPVPAPVAQVGPITQLTFADNNLDVTASLDRGYVLTNGIEPLFMDLKVHAADRGQRSALAAVLVIDRSGSMAGDKIDSARMAAERFISRLQDGDQLAVVSYGTDVAIDLDLTTIDPQTRRRARAVVSRIEEGGGTNIDGALRAAHRVLERAQARVSKSTSRIVLISDGRPTEGARGMNTLARHAESARDLGVSTSTIGVGLDYNEVLMEHLATAGGGRYHYLKRANELAKILDDELTHASRAVARNVRVHLPAGLSAKVLGARSNGGVIDLGDLAAGEVRHVLVELAPERAGEMRFAAPQLVYVDAATGGDSLLKHRADRFRVVATNDVSQLESSRRDEVAIRVLEVKAAVDLTASMEAYSKGNVGEAQRRIETKRNQLKDAARRTKSARLAEEAKNLDAVLGKMKAAPSSSSGMDLVKSQRARAFDLRR